MCFAVTHILVPIILVDLVRDHVFKKHRRMLPNKYILLAGIAGILPDIDIIIRGVIGTYSYITHSLVLPIIFFILSFISYKKIEHRKYYKIFLMFSVGFFTHVILDVLVHTPLESSMMLFYPIGKSITGFGIMSIDKYGFIPMAALDGVLLLLWLIHEEVTHKISDFL